MKIKLFCLTAMVASLTVVGCKEKSPAEKMEDQVNEAAEKTSDAVKDGAEAVKDATK